MAFHELVLEPELEQVLRRARDCCRNCTCSQTSLLRIRPDGHLGVSPRSAILISSREQIPNSDWRETDWQPDLDLPALNKALSSREEDTSDAVCPDIQDDSVKIL